MFEVPAVGGYFLIFGLVTTLLWISKKVSERRALIRRAEAIDAGLTQPSSLHPVIDSAACIGCGSCVKACPEGDVLGLIGGHAVLVEPTRCIGHGACQSACPMDAISLVYGTAERGIDIPRVNPDFETNVPGIFIAGELGGMGLIRNAIEQGRQAMQAISQRIRKPRRMDFDCIIIGAGPSGISASLQAQVSGLKFCTLEQDSFGGTVAHFPRGKLVMTAPVELPGHGRMKFSETTKEALLSFWETVISTNKLEIRFSTRVDRIELVDNGFDVITDGEKLTTDAVLLAIGRRGTPRKLDVPGEEQNKVVYRLIDPEQYRDQAVLVVGGGDSALEAAIAIAEETGTDTTIAYRSAAFSRAKKKNRDRIEALAKSGDLRICFDTVVHHIDPDTVHLNNDGKITELVNDGVIVCAGGILPTPFLKKMGIEVETKYGTA